MTPLSNCYAVFSYTNRHKRKIVLVQQKKLLFYSKKNCYNSYEVHLKKFTAAVTKPTKKGRRGEGNSVKEREKKGEVI